MSALDRLQKNAISGVANANPTKVAKVDTKTPETLAELATLALANSQTSKIEENQPTPEPHPDYAKTMALATGTDWRPPGNPFFLRARILNASMSETYYAYWRAVYLVGSGHTPERAVKYAIADILREWDSRKRRQPALSRNAQLRQKARGL